jgi:DNA-binding MarR family transcriptional regulator
MPKTESTSPRRRAASRPATGRSAAASRRASSRAAGSAVLRQLHELFRVSQQHFQRIETHCGISGAQLWALSELDAHPAMTVSELAEALTVHLSTASNVIAKLEAQGLVRRARDRVDQRVVRIHATRAGTRMLKKAPRPVEGVIPDALRKMPAAALARLERDLAAMLELASRHNHTGRVKRAAAAS